MNQAVQEKPAAKRKPKETGVPDNKKYLHPLMTKNYGKWKYHDRPRPGVLRHVAHSGDQIWTVRAGTQRQMDVGTIRLLCDIADKYAEGHVRFTIRSNIEYMVSKAEKVDSADRRTGKARLPGGWHRQLDFDDRAYPRLAALRHPGYGCIGRGQGIDG